MALIVRTGNGHLSMARIQTHSNLSNEHILRSLITPSHYFSLNFVKLVQISLDWLQPTIRKTFPGTAPAVKWFHFRYPSAATWIPLIFHTRQTLGQQKKSFLQVFNEMYCRIVGLSDLRFAMLWTQHKKIDRIQVKCLRSHFRRFRQRVSQRKGSQDLAVK